MKKYDELVEKIKNHTLGNKEEATALYFAFCACLKEKYGLVDRDFDDNPTKRGKEWIDIHHIREYELDDIARRTQNARLVEKEKLRRPGEVLGIKCEIFHDKEKFEEIKKLNPNVMTYYGVDYTLEELKPYNIKEQLVYANKIEHFLLHYLIVSIRNSKFAGGPNYLWDCSVALDIYGFDQDFMNNLKYEKAKFYSIISSEEITLLYKKLIDWKNWEAWECSKYWMINKKVIGVLNDRQVSYIEDKEKFFRLIDILGFALDKVVKNKIETLPYKAKILEHPDGTKYKVINHNVYSMDEKTIIRFGLHWHLKSFTVPSNIEKIASSAFQMGYHLEKITIPITVKEIESKTFTELNIRGSERRCPYLQKIYYRGTKEMWDANFSNVEIPDGVTVICRKK